LLSDSIDTDDLWGDKEIFLAMRGKVATLRRPYPLWDDEA
jgi:hypothetical protein